jgi:hypothetical protein
MYSRRSICSSVGPVGPELEANTRQSEEADKVNFEN